MNAIRFCKQIDSDTLHLPELRPFLGKMVPFIVLDDAGAQPLETEETFFGLAPPPLSREERAAEIAKSRERAKDNPKLAAFLDALEQCEDFDVDTILKGRGYR